MAGAVLDLAPRLHSPCMVVIRHAARIPVAAMRNAEVIHRRMHPCPPPRKPPRSMQTSVSSELEQSHPGRVSGLSLRDATETAHSRTFQTSLQLINALETQAGFLESGQSSKVSRTMLEDCETDEDAQPPQKKLNVITDAKDADINELAMTYLSQSQQDPGDVYARCSLARYNPQRPWLTWLLVQARCNTPP